jgi:hypothetical protein
MTTMFAGVRLLEVDNLPEFDVTGVRKMEILPGGHVRQWICEDFAADGSKFAVPRLILRIPVRNFVWNAFACAQWVADKGLARVPALGPNDVGLLRTDMQ